MEKVAEPADRIHQMRDLLDMSMKDLSKKTGIAESTICRLETGFTTSIKMETLRKFSDGCGVNLMWLLGYDVPFEKRTREQEDLENEISDIAGKLSVEQLRKLRDMAKLFFEEK